MFPWKVTKEGVQILELPGEEYTILVHTPETGTFRFKGRYQIEKCYEALKDKRHIKLIVEILKIALREIKNE
jgi:hypothetical protein